MSRSGHDYTRISWHNPGVIEPPVTNMFSSQLVAAPLIASDWPKNNSRPPFVSQRRGWGEFKEFQFSINSGSVREWTINAHDWENKRIKITGAAGAARSACWHIIIERGGFEFSHLGGFSNLWRKEKTRKSFLLFYPNTI